MLSLELYVTQVLSNKSGGDIGDVNGFILWYTERESHFLLIDVKFAKIYQTMIRSHDIAPTLIVMFVSCCG